MSFGPGKRKIAINEMSRISEFASTPWAVIVNKMSDHLNDGRARGFLVHLLGVMSRTPLVEARSSAAFILEEQVEISTKTREYVMRLVADRRVEVRWDALQALADRADMHSDEELEQGIAIARKMPLDHPNANRYIGNICTVLHSELHRRRRQ